MLDVKIILDAVPDYLFKACGAETQDERDTVAACVRTYARDCITATLLTIEDGPIFKDAWRYRVMVENGAVPTQWHEIISEQREGFRARADRGASLRQGHRHTSASAPACHHGTLRQVSEACMKPNKLYLAILWALYGGQK